MFNISKIVFLLSLVALPNNLHAIWVIQSTQIDSLIKEKSINNDMMQLELLILYEDAIKAKSKDSIEFFKKLALLNADLDQPKDAFIYTEKYIENTLDFSILNNPAYQYIKKSDEYKTLENKCLVKINYLVFFFFYVALIGFFFSIIINFSKKSNFQNNFFISGFVAVHSLFILEYVIYISNLKYKFPHSYLMASSAALLYGPLLYFYFKGVIENYKFKAKDIWHFLPNIFLIIYLLPLYLLSDSSKIKMMLDIDDTYHTYKYVIFISKVVSLAVYAAFIGKLEYRSRKSNKAVSDIIPASSKWKKNIFRIHVAYVICYIIYGLSISGILVYSSKFLSYAQIIAMSIMVLYICYMAYVQPDVFNNKYVSAINGLFFEKYKKSGLTESLSKELKENLVQLLKHDKIYKQSDISLEIVSNQLNTTRHNTSQIINEHFNMNFFELINKFRINEAIRILEDDVHGSLNIIDIAYEVGYNNKVTFNKAFKKETSKTPSEYISSIHKKTS